MLDFVCLGELCHNRASFALDRTQLILVSLAGPKGREGEPSRTHDLGLVPGFELEQFFLKFSPFSLAFFLSPGQLFRQSLMRISWIFLEDISPGWRAWRGVSSREGANSFRELVHEKRNRDILLLVVDRRRLEETFGTR